MKQYLYLGSAFAIFVFGVVYLARGSVADVWPYILLSAVAYTVVFWLIVRIVEQFRRKS